MNHYTPIFTPDRRDIRALGNQSTGEIMELFDRSVKQGAAGFDSDARQYRHTTEEQCRLAMAACDQLLMSPSLDPYQKFAAVAALMGYVTHAYGGYTRAHIPLRVVPHQG